MDKVNLGGLKIDAVTKPELLKLIAARISLDQKTWITTPYSEFLHAGLKDSRVLDMLNQADIAVTDGIGIFWAKRYLTIPLTANSYWGKILQSLWQLAYSLAAIIFYPSWIKSVLPEKIVGADLVWDLANLAAKNNLTIFLLGGFGNTPNLVSEKLKSSVQLMHGRALTVHVSNKDPNDNSTLEEINNLRPDILLVAYGPVKQELWIKENLPKLNTKLVIGVGGSFDYIAGKKSIPPKFIRYSGLEWLWRLVTQPYRFTRIINATLGLMSYLWHYKVFMSLSMRKNGVGVIFNTEGKIFLARKIYSGVDVLFYQSQEKWKNYWQFPQGGIEEGENLTTATEREVAEETGIKNLQLLEISKHTNSYTWNNAVRKFWHNRKYQFKGQTQHVVYFKYSGNDDGINLPPKEEFKEYQWVDPKDLESIIHPERLPLAKIVLSDLKEMKEKAII